MELRCPGGLKATVLEDEIVEVSCHSRWCGKLPGVVVLHRFNAKTGELVETLQFKAPPNPNERIA